LPRRDLLGLCDLCKGVVYVVVVGHLGELIEDFLRRRVRLQLATGSLFIVGHDGPE